MDHQQLLPNLFRTEYRKITSVLCKRFGIGHIGVAEDIASETFLSAAETWPYKGLPANPTAWLYAVAKNKATNHIHRENIFSGKISAQVEQLSRSEMVPEIDLSERNITDSQLQMLFALCHPSISTEAQIGLSLRILCGFGIDEISDAFLTNKETINKRLYRAREKLRTEKVVIELPKESEISNRLETVLTTLYLLFNEGYYSESQDSFVRKDLCLEAMRLTYLLIENEYTNLPQVNALFSLMCFHASRLDARQTNNGEMILYADQDESLWNTELVARGMYFFKMASQGSKLTRYHLEAGIAYWHTVKADTVEKWENILQLYNRLLHTQYSPIAALNRTYALFKARGAGEAIPEAEKLKLTDNHYYFTLLGVLYAETNTDQSLMNFKKALDLAKTQTDKHTIQQKIQRIVEDRDPETGADNNSAK